MFKFLLFLAGLGAVLWFTPLGSSLKASLVGKMSPATEERASLAQLSKNLDSISRTINTPAFQTGSMSGKVRELNSMLDTARTSLDAAESEAQTGDLSGTLSSLIQKTTSLIEPHPQPTVNICPPAR